MNLTLDFLWEAYCSLKLFRYVVFETQHVVLFSSSLFFFFFFPNLTY